MSGRDFRGACRHAAIHTGRDLEVKPRTFCVKIFASLLLKTLAVNAIAIREITVDPACSDRTHRLDPPHKSGWVTDPVSVTCP